MNGPGDYYTKWSKSDKDKYNITYVQNFLKSYKWTYLQNENRLRDFEGNNSYREEGINWEFVTDTYTRLHLKYIINKGLLCSIVTLLNIL